MSFSALHDRFHGKNISKSFSGKFTSIKNQFVILVRIFYVYRIFTYIIWRASYLDTMSVWRLLSVPFLLSADCTGWSDNCNCSNLSTIWNIVLYVAALLTKLLFYCRCRNFVKTDQRGTTCWQNVVFSIHFGR